MQTPYDVSQPIIHNGSLYRFFGTCEIKTPPQQWSYAAEFPLNRAVSDGHRLHLRLMIRVLKGAIGVGTLFADGSGMHQEVQTAFALKARTVELLTAPGEQAGSILVRNVSPDGRSHAEISLLAVNTVPADTEIGSLKSKEKKLTQFILIDPAALEGFHIWSGLVPPGYFADRHLN
jgi:hypothetical protein